MTTCFACGENCIEGFVTNLDSLKTSKYKTPITQIITNIINDKSLLLMVRKQDTLCLACITLLEEYDQLLTDAKLIEKVLNKQLFRTYEIDSEICENEATTTINNIDKSQYFVLEITEGSDHLSNYKCIYCNFETVHIENVNSHVLYHQTIKKKIEKIAAKEPPKHPVDPVTVNPSKIESVYNDEPNVQKDSAEREVSLNKTAGKLTGWKAYNDDPDYNPNGESDTSEEVIESEEKKVITLKRFDLENQVNLNILEDPDCESNLRIQKCNLCNFRPYSLAEYTKHLKFNHKAQPSHIMQAIRLVVKKPSRIPNFSCPYCFTSFSRQKELEGHVIRLHETINLAAPEQRIQRFLGSMAASVRCKVCDYEITKEVCTHEMAKKTNKMKICRFCSKQFYNDRLYNTHLARQHSYCFLCKFTCKSSFQIKRHFEEKHLRYEKT